MQAETILKQHLAKTIELNDEQFDYVFSHFKRLSFKKGQELVSAGNYVDCEFFVLSGCLKSFYVNDDMKMFILQFAMPTWWASDYDALYYKTKANVTVDCVTDAEVLCLNSDDREKLCRELHPVEHFFRWRTNKGYVSAYRRLLSYMNNDSKGRYDELMNLYPELYNIVPKQLIAAYLGVSRETLSRRFGYKKGS